MVSQTQAVSIGNRFPLNCPCVGSVWRGAGGEWGTGFTGGTALNLPHWLIN